MHLTSSLSQGKAPGSKHSGLEVEGISLPFLYKQLHMVVNKEEDTHVE